MTIEVTEITPEIEDLTDAFATLTLDDYHQPRPLLLKMRGTYVMMASKHRVSVMYMREAMARRAKEEKPESPQKAAARRIRQGIATSEDYEILRAHQEAERQANFQKALLEGFIRTGKTSRHARNGYFNRKRERRIKHEGWMKAVSNNPNQAHPHPFIT